MISVWHPELTICSEDHKISLSHTHTPPLIFPRAPQIQPPVAERWLHATFHRRYQGNWQWLEICSIIEPRPVWLKGLRPPPFETDPSSKAISDIQFVLKLPLRGPKGPDLINIFYGEPLDVAGSASGPVLIIVRAHYGWLCNDSDSEIWQWFMNASVLRQRSDWSLTARRFLLFARPLCDCAVSLTARPCQLEANQKWFM